MRVGRGVGPGRSRQRGFVEAAASSSRRQAPNDRRSLVGDLLGARRGVRQAGAVAAVRRRRRPPRQLARSGRDRWRLDFSRSRRPTSAAVGAPPRRRPFTRGPLTLDLGKQFIRWGKTDIVNPTDRFAPRDFLNVVDNDFLAVTGARGVVQIGGDTLRGVWVPRFTPSRMPLLDQRWTVLPAGAAGVPIVDAGARASDGLAGRACAGATSATASSTRCRIFDGFNHLPNIDVAAVGCSAPLRDRRARGYPAIRTYGADAAVPTRWFTVKGEAAYFTSRHRRDRRIRAVRRAARAADRRVAARRRLRRRGRDGAARARSRSRPIAG